MQREQRDKHLLDDLAIVMVISNPVRYQSRERLFNQAVKHVEETSGVKVMKVELELGERRHKVTKEDPWHVQLTTKDELWHKENLINLGVRRLTEVKPNWKYVAWLDADIEFAREDWALETVHALQHHNVVQMFQSALDYGPTKEIVASYRSFAYCYVTGAPPPNYAPGGYAIGTHWHPGYAWAMRRSAWENLGGLIDFSLVGAADSNMAHALIGTCERSVAKGVHPNYLSSVRAWQESAERYVGRDIGFVPGTVMHHWHGPKKLRGYWTRWEILTKFQFDPVRDLRRDSQGVLQLTDRSPALRDAVRAYFRQRNEDSIDNVAW